jgi:hypothetical protein
MVYIMVYKMIYNMIYIILYTMIYISTYIMTYYVIYHDVYGDIHPGTYRSMIWKGSLNASVVHGMPSASSSNANVVHGMPRTLDGMSAWRTAPVTDRSLRQLYHTCYSLWDRVYTARSCSNNQQTGCCSHNIRHLQWQACCSVGSTEGPPCISGFLFVNGSSQSRLCCSLLWYVHQQTRGQASLECVFYCSPFLSFFGISLRQRCVHIPGIYR